MVAGLTSATRPAQQSNVNVHKEVMKRCLERRT